MLTNDQITTVQKAATYLPLGWKFNMQLSNQAAICIEGPGMRRIRVGYAKTHQHGERFHVWGVGPGNVTTGTKAPDITVDIAAEPQELAEKIQSRLLPAYEEFYLARQKAMDSTAKQAAKGPLANTEAVQTKLLVDQVRQLVLVTEHMRRIISVAVKHIPDLPLEDILEDSAMAIEEAKEWLGETGEASCEGQCSLKG